MKNFTLALNVVLLIAVGILFYLHFSSNKNASVKVNNVAGANNASQVAGPFRIAYFEMDSVENQYEYFKEVRNALRSIEQQKTSELAAKKNAYYEKAKEYQQKGPTMSQAEQERAQQDMMAREKDYQSSEQIKSQELQDESFKRLQDVKKKIEDYLKDYNKDKGYSFIMTSSPDLIYYKDSVYNITNDILKGLNQLYKNKK